MFNYNDNYITSMNNAHKINKNIKENPRPDNIGYLSTMATMKYNEFSDKNMNLQGVVSSTQS